MSKTFKPFYFISIFSIYFTLFAHIISFIADMTPKCLLHVVGLLLTEQHTFNNEIKYTLYVSEDCLVSRLTHYPNIILLLGILSK